jgi:large subunit ribosomal protein L9
MKVILKADVKELGGMGDVVTVKDGHARNYLLPKGLAIIANEKSLKAFEHEKRRIQEMARKIKSDAEGLSSRLSAITLTIKAKAGEEDKLFGSVTASDIAEALQNEGFDVDKKKVVLEEPIKRLGSYMAQVKLYRDVAARVTVNVVSEDVIA